MSRKYEDANGPIPEGPPIDSNGLAQQVRGSSRSSRNQMLDFEPQAMITSTSTSNNAPEDFAQPAQAMITSNNAPEDFALLAANIHIQEITQDNTDFLKHAQDAAQLRRKEQKYNADGQVCETGLYDEHHPPKGKVFSGFYLKGCTGIVWKDEGEEQKPAARLFTADTFNRLFSEILPKGDVEGLRLLLKRNVDINLTLGKGPLSKNTMLHWCAIRGQVDMVRLLVEHGANVELKDVKGRTAEAMARERVEELKCIDELKGRYEEIITLLSKDNSSKNGMKK